MNLLVIIIMIFLRVIYLKVEVQLEELDMKVEVQLEELDTKPIVPWQRPKRIPKVIGPYSRSGLNLVQE